MNIRILPLALAMGLTASFAVAQQSVRTAQPLPYLRGVDATLEQHNRPASPAATPENTIIFQDDFSAGSSSWTNQGFEGTNNGSTPDTTGVWEYRGPATTPNTGTGSRGAYGTANLTVQSSTPANGFMVFDSDWLDNNGVQGAFGQGIFPAPHRAMLISPSFNSAQYPYLNLEFYQYYRRFAGPTSQAQPATYVLFSINGGATWDDTLMINSNIAVNQATARNSLIRVNVSDYIGGAANAKIAFMFHGDYYFWQIDDVKITQAPNHDLALVQSIFLPDTANGRFLEYGMVPAPNTGGVVFQALVRNVGTLSQTNVTLTVNATPTSGGAPLYTSTSSIPSLAPGTEQVISLNTIFPATTIAKMNVSFNVTADSTDAYTLNNSATRQFAITDSAFSPSVIAPVSQSYSGTGQWGNPAAQQISLGNLFEILTADTVTSATAYLQTGATGTQAGSSVVFTVRSPGTDGLPGDLTTVLFESDVYTITSQDIARGFIVVPFPATLFGSPQDRVVEPGDHWLVAEMFSNNGANRIRFLDDVTFTMPWFASVLYTDDWYNNGNAMRMFMNFGRASSGVSVQELAADVRLNLYPNPAQGDYAMLEIAAERPAGKVTCEISDMTGRLVVTQSSQISGMSETLPLDISALNTGLYQVRVNMLGGSRTLRLVVNR
ncbi:MAG: T9SS type A sorting domain-containing protein [Sphingomonadales bacterium]|nr:T9SS type A sorting domain-containing protein [Sphingomonadales bacterium]